MTTVKMEFHLDDPTDDQIETLYEVLPSYGAYDITDEEVEPPKVLPHNRQKKPKP